MIKSSFAVFVCLVLDMFRNQAGVPFYSAIAIVENTMLTYIHGEIPHNQEVSEQTYDSGGGENFYDGPIWI